MESSALDLLDRVLALPSGGVQVPSLDDGNVVQNIPLVPDIVRRSRTFGGSTGWFYGLMRCALSNATQDANVQVDPYSSGTFISPWLDPVPKDFDIWIESAHLIRIVGNGAVSADFNEALLSIDPVAGQQAFGVTSAGGALTSNSAFPIGHWNSVGAVSNAAYGLTDAGDAFVPIRTRLRRDALLNLAASATLGAGETMNVDCYLLIGAFPVSLGSDVAK